MATPERVRTFPRPEVAELLGIAQVQSQDNPGYQVVGLDEYLGRPAMPLTPAAMESTLDLCDQVLNDPPAEIDVPVSQVPSVLQAFMSASFREYFLEKMTVVNIDKVAESKRLTDNTIGRIALDGRNVRDDNPRLIAAYSQIPVHHETTGRNAARLREYLKQLPPPYRVAIISGVAE